MPDANFGDGDVTEYSNRGAAKRLKRCRRDLAQALQAKEKLFKDKQTLEYRLRTMRLELMETKKHVRLQDTHKNRMKMVRDYLGSVGLSRVQISKIMFPDQAFYKCWSPEEVCHAMVIQSISTECYKYLQENTILALPSKTLLKLLPKDIKTVPGFQNQVFDFLSDRFSLGQDGDREACIMFNEMGIKKKAEYSNLAESFFGPVSKVQVVILRALTWKQIIYFDFERPMSRELLFQLIQECEQVGVRIRSICSDQGNPDLMSELDLYSSNKFENPVDPSRWIYNFPGMMMCMKSIKALHEELQTPGIRNHDGTIKTSQDSGENLFAQLRAMGNDPHPGPADFIQRIDKLSRALLMPLQNNGGTIEDDSPNVVNQLNLKLEAVQDLQEVVQDIEVVTEDHHQVMAEHHILGHEIDEGVVNLEEVIDNVQVIVSDTTDHELELGVPIEITLPSVPLPPYGLRGVKRPHSKTIVKAAKKARASFFKPSKRCRSGLPELSKTVVCNHCSDEFPSIVHVREHYHNGSPTDNISIIYQDAEGTVYPKADLYPGKKLLACIYCKYLTDKVSNMKQHLSGLKHKNLNLVDLDSSYRVFKKLGYERGEEKLVARKPRKPIPIGQKIDCGICNYKCSAQSTLATHLRTVHQLNPAFPCTQCDYETASKEDFIQHMKDAHKLILGFRCDQCNFKTPHRSNFNQHMALEHDLKGDEQLEDPDYEDEEEVEDLEEQILEDQILAEEQILGVEEEETSVIQDHGHDYLIQTVPAVESEQIISLLPES